MNPLGTGRVHQWHAKIGQITPEGQDLFSLDLAEIPGVNKVQVLVLAKIANRLTLIIVEANG